MNDADRFRLLGTYRTPRFRYGRPVVCEVRGEVTVCGLSAGPIPWPVGKRGRAKALIVYSGLARAVRRESELAVARWWGVTPQTVWKWRKALGVGAATEGTSRLRRDHFAEPWAEAARAKAHAQSRDAEADAGRRAKIAAAKRGKPRPRHIIEAMAAGRRGKPHTAGARRKMSAAHRRRGTRPPRASRPWTAAEDGMLRQLPAAEVAQRTGRTLGEVYGRRRVLELLDGRAGRKGPRR